MDTQKRQLTLREVSPEDLAIFFEQQKDPAACHMAAFTREDPTDRDAVMAHFEGILGDESVMMRTIVSDGRVGGSIGSYVDEQFGHPEVTYWIGREYWGQGIATAALRQFLNVQTARPLYGRAASDNAASLRVLEKCGFEVVGCDKGLANARSEEIDELLLVLR